MNIHQNLLNAVACNHVESVAQLCGTADCDLVGKALKFAVFQHKDIAIVRHLLALKHAVALTPILLIALERKNLEAFEVILEGADPLEDKRRVVHEAVMRGYTSCVQQLLKQCSIDAYGHQLLAQACFNKQENMVDLLYDLCDAQQALDFLSAENINDDGKRLIMERMEREQLRESLSTVVNTATPIYTGVRKI